jgi:hypothetical protein
VFRCGFLTEGWQHTGTNFNFLILMLRSNPFLYYRKIKSGVFPVPDYLNRSVVSLLCHMLQTGICNLELNFFFKFLKNPDCKQVFAILSLIFFDNFEEPKLQTGTGICNLELNFFFKF